jgi:saccharopine dehydrogenase-like NADP-dependent oxidoreductase
MKLLRDSGFFAKDPVTVDGHPVVPLELTARVLFPKLQLPPGEGDLTVMTITGKGLRNGRKSRLSFSLLDYFDPETGITSMARTTGYTATSVAALWRAGKIRSRGLVLPEYLGREEGFLDLLLGELAGRGVHYRREESVL